MGPLIPEGLLAAHGHWKRVGPFLQWFSSCSSERPLSRAHARDSLNFECHSHTEDIKAGGRSGGGDTFEQEETREAMTVEMTKSHYVHV